MSNRGKLTLAVLGAIAALLACWLAWGARPDSKRVENVVEPPVARSDELRVESNDVHSRAAELPAEDVRPAANAESIANRSVRVTGRCVDRDHRPVADARVELTEISWWPKGQEHAKSIHGGIDDPAVSLPHTQSATNGAFSIAVELEDESPHGSVITVVARKEGYCLAGARKDGAGHGELSVGDLVLEPGTRASGMVRDVLGHPCGGVHLSVLRKDRDAKSGRVGDQALSAANGSFAFDNAPSAMCTLFARADDLRMATLDIDLADGPRTDIEVVLPELNGADSISGTVVDPEGHPVSGAWLIEQTSAGPEPRVNVSTGCDGYGRFRIDGHPDSTFVLTAGDRDHRWCGVRREDIKSGTHDIVLQLDGSKTFVLRVRGENGEAIERFGYERYSELWGGQAPMTLENHVDGDATLASDITPFSLLILAPGWHSARVDKLDPEHLPSVVPVVLHRACVLRGIVRMEGRTKPAWVKAEEFKLTDTPESKRQARPPANSLTDANGRFEMTVEGTGTLRLRALYRDELSAPTQPIAVKPGEDVDDIAIEFVATGSIEGAVFHADGSPAAQVAVIATQAAKSLQSVRSDEAGRFRFAGLPPGEYVLLIAIDRGWMQLEVHDPTATRSSQTWPARVDAGVATKIDLRLLETARCHIALGLPDPPDSRWAVDASIHFSRDVTDTIEKQIRGNESVDLERADPFEVSITLDSFKPGWPRFYVPKQQIDRGSRDVTIASSTGRIEGNLSAPFATDETVELKWKAPTVSAESTATIDAAGRFAFECVPVGECSIERSKRAGATRSVFVTKARSVVVTSAAVARVDDL
jgi:hypothetical protein